MLTSVVCPKCLHLTDTFICEIKNNGFIRINCCNCAERFNVNFIFKKVPIDQLKTEKNIETS